MTKSSDMIKGGTPVKSVTSNSRLYEPGITINWNGTTLKIYRMAQHANGDVFVEDGGINSKKFESYIMIPSKNIKKIEYYNNRR